MRTDVIINPAYLNLSEYIKSIPDIFQSLRCEHVMHEGRNIIKWVEVDGVKLVIKKYDRISMLNRFVYGRIRCSKAVRSYRNAMNLQKLNIDTPHQVAAIDVYNGCYLISSFYISLYSDYSSFDTDCIVINNEDTITLLDSLADFLVFIHDRGIEHNDLNITNILYKRSGGSFRFQLIDINRVRFHHNMSTHRRMKNLRRLSLNYTSYMYIMERYAERVKLKGESFELHCAAERMIFEHRQRLKSKIKSSVHKHN